MQDTGIDQEEGWFQRGQKSVSKHTWRRRRRIMYQLDPQWTCVGQTPGRIASMLRSAPLL